LQALSELDIFARQLRFVCTPRVTQRTLQGKASGKRTNFAR